MAFEFNEKKKEQWDVEYALFSSKALYLLAKGAEESFFPDGIEKPPVARIELAPGKGKEMQTLTRGIDFDVNVAELTDTDLPHREIGPAYLHQAIQEAHTFLHFWSDQLPVQKGGTPIIEQDWPFAEEVGVWKDHDHHHVYCKGNHTPILRWPECPLFLAFSSEQRFLFAVGHGADQDRKCLFSLKEPKFEQEIDLAGEVKQVVFSEDERYFLLLMDSGSLTLWSTQGEQLFTLRDPRFMNLLAVGFSPDGHFVRLFGELTSERLSATDKRSYQYGWVEWPIHPDHFVQQLDEIIDWELSAEEWKELGIAEELDVAQAPDLSV